MKNRILKRITNGITMLSTVLLLNACAYVYQPDVQQGNYVTADMLNNVELGMTKLQVEYYLGRPLIQDPFHNDRWDYFYSYRERQNKEREERNLVLFFDDNGLLAKIDGNIETEKNKATTPAAPELSKPNIDESTLSWYEKIFL